MARYRIAPAVSTEMPSGIPFIVANEAAERFSYYGMRAILVIYMTQYMMNAAGQPDHLSDHQAQAYFHLFVSAVYITPLLGALLSDGLLGKYRTILALSMVYCIGHFALALDDTLLGLLIGQGLIALGAGGIKPCVSAHLGDQFGRTNQRLLSRAFSGFYFAINLGAFGSMLLIPWLLKEYGSQYAFGLPGLLMLAATIIFWSGRHRFVHIPAGGIDFLRETVSRGGMATLGKLSLIYLFIAVFWALFDQTGSSWVLQAQKLDRVVFGYQVLPSQIQAANPLLILLLTPLFSYWLYPAMNRLFELTALRKIAIGLFITAFAFAIPALLQIRIDAGQAPNIGWQLLAYLVLTAAEVMVSITCLEFSYTQAPKRMKSLVMAFFMLSVATGNLFTSAVNFFIQNEDGTVLLKGADYFWFFTGLMGFTALLFLIVVRFYQPVNHLQDEA